MALPSNFVEPTACEQALLEYINHARTDPDGEFDRLIANAASGTGVQGNITNAIRYFGVDVDAFRSQMAAFDPVAPLAWNSALAGAATDHSELMIDYDTQSHNLPGEARLLNRVQDAGYDNLRKVGENVYAYTDDPLQGHAGFMIDWGYDDADFTSSGSLRSDWQSRGDGIQDAAGHRMTIMSDAYADIGISALAENDSSTRVGPYVVTQNFGSTWGDNPAQLVGVVIDDADGDRIYDIGEGLGEITVTASGSAGTFTTTTWGSGGYQMELPAGSYTVRFSGGALDGVAQYSITMGNENLKRDGFAADAQRGLDDAGSSGGEVMSGLATDDILTGAGGKDVLNGRGGNDLLIGDGLEAGYFPESADQVFRLYQAVLGRMPDAAGYLAWTDRIALEGRDPASVAKGFMGSPEFQSEFSGQSNTGFVTLLYNNVLDRDPDARGLERWTGELAAGADRADVVLGFANSAEFRQDTAAAARSFADARSQAAWSDDVYRLYQATLDRTPDTGGFANWTDRLATGTSFLEVADSFVRSPQFKASYDGLDDAGFVTLLYDNVLNRAPDATGLANWTGRLDGGMSRAEVVRGFSQSAEFAAATADDVTAWIRAQGTDDTLNGGTGNDRMAGGMMSDRFVFTPNAPGSDTVLDLEAWDRIDLAGFGFDSDAQARARMSQAGSDVVFDAQDVVITFQDVTLAQITNDMILV